MKGAKPILLENTPVHSLHDALRVMLQHAPVGPHAPDESIHAARKTLKRARAALRLLRASLGDTVYRRENRQIRDAAKPLTPVRDAAVLLESVERLRYSADTRDCKTYLRHLHKLLYEERQASRTHLTTTVVHQSAIVLRQVADRVSALPAQQPDVITARRGIKNIYERGQQARKHAQRHADDLVLHEWRKQVKYLLNALELAKSLFRVNPKKLRRYLRKLAKLLGDDHDLAVLGEKIRRFRRRALLPSAADAHRVIKARISSKREALQDKAYTLGKRVYSKSARRLSVIK